MLKNVPNDLIRAFNAISNPLRRFLTGTMIPILGVARPAFFARNFFDNQVKAGLEFSAAGFNAKAGNLAKDILMGKGLDNVVEINGIKQTKRVLKERFFNSGLALEGGEKIGARARSGNS